MALPGLVWVEIQSSTIEIDRDLKMLDVAEAACRFLHPLDGRIDRLEAGIGDSMLQIGQHVGQMAADALRDLGHRPQPAVRGAPELAGKELLGDAPIGVIPELAEALLEGPGPRPP